MLKKFSKISLMCLALSMAELVYSSADNTVVGEMLMNAGPFAGYAYDLAVSADGLTLYFPIYNIGYVYLFSTVDNSFRSYIDRNGLGATFWGPLSIAINPAGTFAYLGCDESTVYVINLATNLTVAGPISVGSYPGAIISNLDGSKMYVANRSGNTVSVIRTSDNTVTSTITGFNAPIDLAMTPDGLFIYVTNNTTDNVSIIDTSTDLIVGSPITVGDAPRGIAITPDGLTAYVANSGADSVSVIDLSDDSVTLVSNTLGTPFDTPTAVAVSADGSTLYVSNAIIAGFISVVDTTTNAVTEDIDNGSFSVENPVALAFVPDSFYLYTSNRSDEISSDYTSSQIFTFVAISAPATIIGVSQSNVFFTQTDYINTISWTVPTEGTVPTSYNIYRDADLTNLAGTVLATSPLVYYDHNRIPGVTYTYYVVSVDADDAESSAISVSVTTKNN